jgi:hypothetical protein
MKPILVFTAIGDHRQAERDEWFKNRCGDMVKSIGRTDDAYDIYTLAEIPVPEGATTLTVQVRGNFNSPPAHHINLPRPKVKKWKWATVINGKEIISHCPLSSLEMAGAFNWSKLPGTEIEE